MSCLFCLPLTLCFFACVYRYILVAGSVSVWITSDIDDKKNPKDAKMKKKNSISLGIQSLRGRLDASTKDSKDKGNGINSIRKERQTVYERKSQIKVKTYNTGDFMGEISVLLNVCTLYRLPSTLSYRFFLSYRFLIQSKHIPKDHISFSLSLYIYIYIYSHVHKKIVLLQVQEQLM